MNISLSPALPEDADEIFRLNRDLIDRYEDVSSIDYDRVLHWVRQNISQQIPNFRRIMVDGNHTGFFCLSPTEGKWELDSLFVLPEFQGRGIGAEVLRRCIGETEGALFLYVFRNNTGAVRLYERLGFRVAEEVGASRYIMEYEKQGC